MRTAKVRDGAPSSIKAVQRGRELIKVVNKKRKEPGVKCDEFQGVDRNSLQYYEFCLLL